MRLVDAIVAFVLALNVFIVVQRLYLLAEGRWHGDYVVLRLASLVVVAAAMLAYLLWRYKPRLK